VTFLAYVNSVSKVVMILMVIFLILCDFSISPLIVASVQCLWCVGRGGMLPEVVERYLSEFFSFGKLLG